MGLGTRQSILLLIVFIARNTDNVLTFRTLNDTYILDVIGGLVLSQLLAQHYLGSVLPARIAEGEGNDYPVMTEWINEISTTVA